MRTRFVILIAVVAAIAPAAWADNKADEAAVRSLMARLETAFRHKDVDGIMALSTPDFTEKAMGQTMTAAQAAAELRSEFKYTTVHRMDFKVKNIELNGRTAVVNTTDLSDVTIKDAAGQFGPKGKSHRMTNTGAGRATLVKQNGKWKCKMYEQLTMAMKLDGKPFNPMAGAAPPKK